MSNGGLDPTLGAILPLIGVALGAVLAVAGAYVLKLRDEKRERRAVARLLLDELTDCRNRLHTGIEVGGTWLSLSRWQPPTAVWREHGLLLARHLGSDDLNWLRAAYASVLITPGMFAEWTTSESGREDFARGTLETVEKARSVCERHAEL